MDILDDLTANSVDPKGWGPIRRWDEVERLTECSVSDLIRLIEGRNAHGKPTFLAREALRRKLEGFEDDDDDDSD